MVNQRLRLFARVLLVSGCWALSSGSASAQVGGKPYQQWTAEEAKGLLTDSPWAQTRAGLVAVGRLDPQTAPPNTAVTITLHSALPVRQALARMRQLKTKYDKRSDRDQAAIDAKNKPLLECAECDDYYMVAMNPGPDSISGVPASFARMSLALAKRDVQLTNEKGETRELVKLTRPKFAEDQVMFFFSRLNSKGEPLIGPANRTLTISFDPRIFDWKTGRTTRFEFDVSKMIVNGQVVF